MIQVCADTIDAASGEFGEGLEQGRIASIVEYHDSKGYLEYVAQQLAVLRASHSDPTSQSLLSRFQAVLAKAEWIVAPFFARSDTRSVARRLSRNRGPGRGSGQAREQAGEE